MLIELFAGGWHAAVSAGVGINVKAACLATLNILSHIVVLIDVLVKI